LKPLIIGRAKKPRSFTGINLETLIRSAKAHYRKQFLQSLLDRYDEYNTEYSPPTVLDAIRFFASGWKKVTADTIKNCWRHTNILSATVNSQLEQEIDTKKVEEAKKEVENSINDCIQQLSIPNSSVEPMSAQEFIEIDANEQTAYDPNDSELVQTIFTQEGYNIETCIESGSDNDEVEIIESAVLTQKITKKQIFEASDLISRYLMQQNTLETASLIENMQEIIEFVEKSQRKGMVQSTISSFFSPTP
jgi:hypothetical protein